MTNSYKDIIDDLDRAFKELSCTIMNIEGRHPVITIEQMNLAAILEGEKNESR